MFFSITNNPGFSKNFDSASHQSPSPSKGSFDLHQPQESRRYEGKLLGSNDFEPLRKYRKIPGKLNRRCICSTLSFLASHQPWFRPTQKLLCHVLDGEVPSPCCRSRCDGQWLAHNVLVGFGKTDSFPGQPTVITSRHVGSFGLGSWWGTLRSNHKKP